MVLLSFVITIQRRRSIAIKLFVETVMAGKLTTEVFLLFNLSSCGQVQIKFGVLRSLDVVVEVSLSTCVYVVNEIRFVLVNLAVVISLFSLLMNSFLFFAVLAFSLFVLELLFTMLSFFCALEHLFVVLLASLTVLLGLFLDELLGVGKFMMLVLTGRLMIIHQLILAVVRNTMVCVNVVIDIVMAGVDSSGVRVILMRVLTWLGMTVVRIAFSPLVVWVLRGMGHVVVLTVMFSHVVVKTTSFWLVELAILEEFGNRDVVVVEELRHGDVVVVHELSDRDIVLVNVLADLVLEEFRNRDIIIFKVLGHDRVKELNDRDLVVTEEFSDSGVQVEHGHDDIVGALAEELSYRNVVLIKEFSHGNIVVVHELGN